MHNLSSEMAAEPMLATRATSHRSRDEPLSQTQFDPLRIVFFGHDSSESTIVKRVKALTENGADVAGFMFRRKREGQNIPPSWTNTNLGYTFDGHFARRVFQLVATAPKLVSARRTIRKADVIYARNADMLILAFFAKILTGARARVVYEALDVHPACTGTGWISSTLRFVERRMLARIALLVISSETFLDRYFRPIQNYKGPWFLLENKVFLNSSARIEKARRSASDHSWKIGWFGVIRCQRSLEIFENLARALPDRVTVHIRGTASETHGITTEQLHAISDRNSNIHFFGPYRNPDDLSLIYSPLDLCWAVDYSAAGSNSDWLIPNRIYESGLYGVPCISRSGTATARVIHKYGSGWSLDEPMERNLRDFISNLTLKQFEELAASLRAKDPGVFIDRTDTQALLHRLNSISRHNFRTPAAEQFTN
jgi:succinoglycan biosynthesis protein ExoL